MQPGDLKRRIFDECLEHGASTMNKVEFDLLFPGEPATEQGNLTRFCESKGLTLLVRKSDKLFTFVMRKQPQAQQLPPSDPDSPDAQSAPHRSVLLIEDAADDAFLIKRILRAEPSLAVQTVSDGDEAIAYLQGQGRFSNRAVYPMPNLLVVDLKLARVNGFQVLDWLMEHEQFKDLPAVVLTNSDRPVDQLKARVLGARDYLLKWDALYNPKTFVAKIREHLDATHEVRPFALESRRPAHLRPAANSLKSERSRLPC